MPRHNPTGSTFDSFLEEQGLLVEVRMGTVKRGIARDLAKAMKSRKATVAGLANAMGTTTAVVRRLLDPANPGVTLGTLVRASIALGCTLRVTFTPDAAVAEVPKRKAG